MAITAGPTDCSSGLSNRIFNGLVYDNPWQANKAYPLMSWPTTFVGVCPTTPNGWGYVPVAITTGISGAVEPVWPTTPGGTVVDGGVTWGASTPNVWPSAKGVSFQSLMVVSDLNAIRVLAYDIARTMVDSLNGDLVDPFSQVAAALPFLSATSAAGQVMAVGTNIIVFGTTVTDTDGGYNAGTGRYTVPAGKGGDYLIVSEVQMNTTQAGISNTEVFKNGALLKYLGTAPTQTNGITLSGSIVERLAAGDVIDIRFQNGGAGGQTLSNIAAVTYFQMKCISRA